MRFLHLSDLHLGKRVCEFSMLDDQRYILEQILSLLDSHPVDAVLLAGDLYDKPVPLPRRSACWTGSSPNFPAGSCRCSPSRATTIPLTVWPLALPAGRKQGLRLAGVFRAAGAHHPHRRTRSGRSVLTALFEARYGAARLAGRAH